MSFPRNRFSTQRQTGSRGTESLQEFFGQLRWTRAAPVPVRRAAAGGDLAALARALAEHLAQRQRPRSLSTLTTGANPYLWSLAKPGQVAEALEQLLGTQETRRMVHAGGRPSRNGWAQGDSPASASNDSLPGVVALLCCVDLLVSQAGTWDPERFLETLRRLLGAAKADGGVEKSDLATVVLRHGELPWSAALLWPEMRVSQQRIARARRALEAGLTRLCAPDGVPHPQHLGELPLLLASLCRSLWLARNAGKSLWRPPLARRWRNLLLNSLRLRRADGTLPLAGPSATAPAAGLSVALELDDELIEAALALSGDRGCRAAWATARGLRHGRREPAPRAPAPSVQSDEAQLSVLRAQWQRGGSTLVVRHDRNPVEIELGIRGEQVLSGPWQFQLQADGKRLEAPAACQAVCWMADEDVIYLELRMKWPGGVVLERQMLLGRREPFALLADAVKADRARSLSYMGCMSLAANLGGRTDRRSRIGWVQRPGKRRFWLVPLGLEQWRVDRSAGALELEGDQVRLHATGAGKGLYAPLLLHAYPLRAESVDWRALTVTQSRRVLRPDRAVAYRIRFGPHRQLLLYRTLAPRGTRAVLGHQTKSEFVFGWFDRDGDLEPLLEVT